MTRQSTTLSVAALVVLAAPLTLAGCASSDPGPSSSSTTSASSWSAAMGSCLRDEGYDVDDSDVVEGVVAPPPGVDQDAYLADWETCRTGLPREIRGDDDEPSPDDVAAAQEAGLKVAQCVRDAGFPDFPDPVDGSFPPLSPGDDPQSQAIFACDAEHGVAAGGGAR